MPANPLSAQDRPLAALRVLGIAETSCDALPSTRESHSFEVTGRQILRLGPDGLVLPAVGPVPAPGERLRGAGTGPGVRLDRRLAVDEVRLAKLGGGQMRMRAFYGDDGVTAAVHHGPAWRRPRLLAAATARRAMTSSGVVGAPAFVRSGSRRGVAWLVEETVEAAHPGLHERDLVARELGPLLLATGSGLGCRRAAVTTVLARRGVLALRDLMVARAEHLPTGLVAGVRALVRDDRSVVLATGHGDPVLSNVMRRTRDGLLLLVDWEMAGTAPVGQDAAKLVLGTADPLAALATSEPAFARVARPGDLPWDAQVAVALLRLLTSWRTQSRTAVTMGRAESFERRLTARLDLLGRLLVARPDLSA